MKNILLAIVCIASLSAIAQDSKVEFDGKNWNPPYTLSTPPGWNVERFQIPIEFAPQIPYKGIEDIRFTPGWGNVKTDEYWSYAFLWYLDSMPAINEQIIEHNLQAYYSGLIDRNIVRRKIPAEKLFPTKASFKKTTTTKGDLETYSGTIHMLDYMEQKPMVLNCLVHVRPYKEKNKTIIFHEISPKDFSSQVWVNLNKLWTSFEYK